MRIASLITSHHRNGGKTFHVEISEESLWSHARWRAYHWYDMRVPNRIPGWKRFEKWLKSHGAEIREFVQPGDPGPRWRDRPLGWPIRQDIRCYELGHGSRKTLLVKEVTAEEYLKLGGTIQMEPRLPRLKN